jgi:hypothetical protein
MTSGKLGAGYVLGGVTVTLGSDASYDTHYRNSFEGRKRHLMTIMTVTP